MDSRIRRLRKEALQCLRESEEYGRASKALLYSCTSSGMNARAFASAMSLLAEENRALERAEAIEAQILRLRRYV